jgi:hypothetical protein
MCRLDVTDISFWYLTITKNIFTIYIFKSTCVFNAKNYKRKISSDIMKVTSRHKHD